MALRRVFVSALLTALLFCFVAVQAMLDQTSMTVTKDAGKTVIIGCRNQGNCNDYLHWYQKKDGSGMQRILYMNLDGSKPVTEGGFNEFNADLVRETYRLKINTLEAKHAATYYCACWDDSGNWVKIFGSGTRLIVSDRRTAHPSVTIYHNPKNRELLCVARNMFPDVLRMTWQKNDGSKWTAVDQKFVPTTIQEMKDTLSSLIISDKNGTEELEKYACLVEHESNPTPQQFPVVSTKAGGNENSREAVSGQVTCQPKKSNDSSPDTDHIKKSELLTVSLSYCMLILKSLTYFGIMSVIIYKRSSQTS